MPRRFEKCGISYFLTWPKCSVPKESALEQLKALVLPTNIVYLRVCEDKHQDGSPHLHALVQFQEKYRCTNFRKFDLKHSTNSRSFHENVETERSASDAKTYIEKDGVFCEWGTFKVDGRSARTNQRTINEAYAQAINSGCKEEALQIIKELVPRDYLCNYHNLSANMD
ncbi:hypothetical protein V6N13_033619 [Hibiscus sabdariffa]|uniref:CRESS-DNA virus Rep endonuclease domain-containing protein n=1 Tax=Hibiscus sabdariffa TaxID=183260 RepID=A0ABR2F9Y4_9ROSI